MFDRLFEAVSSSAVSALSPLAAMESPKSLTSPPARSAAREGLWRPYVDPPSLETKLSASLQQGRTAAQGRDRQVGDALDVGHLLQEETAPIVEYLPPAVVYLGRDLGQMRLRIEEERLGDAGGRCGPAQIDQSELVGRRLELADRQRQPKRLVSRHQGAEHDEPESQQRQLLELVVQRLDQLCEEVFSAHRLEQRPEECAELRGQPSNSVGRGAESLSLNRTLSVHPGVSENDAGQRPHEHGADSQGEGQAGQEGDGGQVAGRQLPQGGQHQGDSQHNGGERTVALRPRR